MLIDKGGKWLFVSNPKCGTHTMYKFLEKLGGERLGNFHQNVFPLVTPLPPLVFTTCRNPFDRVVSAYTSAYKLSCLRKSPEILQMEFEEFVNFYLKGKRDLVTLRSQRWMTRHLPEAVTFINLNHINAGLQQLGILQAEQLYLLLPHENKSDHQVTETYYLSTKIKNLIREAYADDFSLLGFNKEDGSNITELGVSNGTDGSNSA